MAIVKPNSGTGGSKPDSGRRSFIWKTGTAISAVMASAVTGISRQKAEPDAGLKDQINRLARRVGSLEDAGAIRRLHQEYESCLERGMYEEVVGMFDEEAEVVYNGGVFAGRAGIRRLYCAHFASGGAGKKIQPPPGFETDPEKQLDVVEVAEDGETAAGRFSYSMQAGAAMTGDSSLVEMARLQGEGIVHWWEGGILEVSCVKKDGAWKIRKLEFLETSKADYKPGRTYAKPIEIPVFSSTFPANPSGPDRLA